jgi:hypothetical protein
MKKTAPENHHTALEKLINFLLFEQLHSPLFEENQTLRLSNYIISQMKSIAERGKETDTEELSYNFENECKTFVEKLDKEDRMNLLKCYGTSEIRFLNHVLAQLMSVSKTDSSDLNHIEIREAEIATELIWDKKLPNEISQYLKTHFSDFLTFIPLNTDRLSKEQYDIIFEKFSKNLDNEEATEKILRGYA